MKHAKFCRVSGGGLILVGALACGADEPIAAPLPDANACTLSARKAAVAEIMSTYYLWFDQVEAVDAADYATPQELMWAMTYHELDRWSGMEELVQRQAFFGEGRYQGYGYTLAQDPEGALRVSWVHSESAAGRAGLDRGAVLLSVNGRAVADMSAIELGEAFSADRIRHEVLELDGTTREVELVAGDVTITSVKNATVLSTDAGPVGYFMFTSFIEPGDPELRAAFQDFGAAGIKDLVVDLRYNGGGLLSIAGVLGSLIQQGAAGQPLIIETYNRLNSNLNAPLLLEEEPEGLRLERVVFLTTEGTASASEQVINGLEPFMDVRVVGTRTLGKPVGADSWAHCGYAITPITFESLNSAGEGRFFDGIAPDCTVADDLTHLLGDPAEAQLSAALELLATGVCPTDSALHLRLEQPAWAAHGGARATHEFPNWF